MTATEDEPGAAEVLEHEDEAATETERPKCPGCLEDLDTRSWQTIPISCGHHWCFDCLNMNVQQSLASRATWPPKCCDTWLETGGIDEIWPYLTNEIQKLYNKMAPELYSENPTHCPEPNCGAFIPDDEDDENAIYAICPNPKCQGSGVCRRCKRSMSEHVLIVEEERIECPDGLGAENNKLLEEGKMQRCPTCRTLIEKEEGCDHMKCTQCSTDFCYLCSRPL